jgi:cytochrome P450
VKVDYEPLSERFHADPYPVYRELRDREPVHWAPEAGVFCLSRYDDVYRVLRQADAFSSRAMLTVLMNPAVQQLPLRRRLLGLLRFLLRTRVNPLALPRAGNLITLDPPRHDLLRAVVNRGFTPRRIAHWEPRIRELARELAARPRAGEPFDVVEDLAVPLPTTIIAEMLGVDPERHADFKRWSDAIISGSTGSLRHDPRPERLLESVGELYAYLGGLVRRRRRAPGDDLVSLIAAEQDGEAGLSNAEVFQFVLLLLVAGNETTTNLIGSAVRLLLEHPAVLERVRVEPELVPAVVEEALRHESPIQLVFRTVTREVEIRGVRIPQGAVVAPLLGSANRDERRFPDPDRFDPRRDPRGHLAFGFGVHFCLGASLARLEARAALEAILPELPRRALAPGPPPLVDSFLVRGPRRLELLPAA